MFESNLPNAPSDCIPVVVQSQSNAYHVFRLWRKSIQRASASGEVAIKKGKISWVEKYRMIVDLNIFFSLLLPVITKWAIKKNNIQSICLLYRVYTQHATYHLKIIRKVKRKTLSISNWQIGFLTIKLKILINVP